MKAKLTAKLVNSLKPKDRMYKVWDTDIPGYFIRVSPTGTMTYCFFYRHEGKGRDYTLGKSGKLTAEEARNLAKEKVPEATRGNDIQEAKKEARIKADAEKYQTLRGFLEYRFKPWVLSERKTSGEMVRVLDKNFVQLYEKRLDKITSWDIQKWRTDKLKEGLKPASLNRYISVLKSALSKAVEWEVIYQNPLSSLKPLKLDDKAKVRYLSLDEEKQLRNTLDKREVRLTSDRDRYNEWRQARDYEPFPNLNDCTYADYLKPMVLLAINTGMRRGELFSLSWQDVNLKQRSLTIEGAGAKSGKTRHIPLNDEAFAILVAWRNDTESKTLVFPSPVSGERMDNIKKSWGNLIVLSEVEDFRFHDLRHTFASKLVMAGVDLNTVRELLGHSSIDMTLRYAHLAPEHKAAAVALLNQKELAKN